jgi:signal transduction histidine kinase
LLKQTVLKIVQRNYWICQIAGWLGMVLIEISNYTFFIAKQFIPELALSFFLQAVSGILIMHAYRWYLKRTGFTWQANSRIWIKAFIETVILACLQTIAANAIFVLQYGQPYMEQFSLVDVVGNIYNWMRYIGVWVIIYFMYQILRQSNAIERAKILAEKNSKQVELELLKTQLNPHFLFNALNSIKALVIIDPEKCRNAIVQLSEILRFTLQYSREKTIPLEQELAEVEKYLSLEQLRFAGRLQVEIQPSSWVAQCTIPPAMLLTLAENAVKHGIGQLEEGGSITIYTTLRDNLLHIHIHNSGHYQPKEHTGIGLKQIRTRLEAIYGEQASLNIHNDNNKVLAELIIPQL